YNHLHEAPTVFYAVGLLLAIIGQGDGMNALLAWIYVGLRVIHSLVQATANKVMVRFVLFALSSLVLIALILHAAMAVFGFI
ncbi:MAPEG family protein, partial [Pseudomonas sp. 71_D]|uniref:MAPEG family protein n=1 Tax=Pseudomonas sp. 71_D TaxID=2813564 RepID=UPI001A9FED84